MKGKLANWVGSQYPSHYLGTCCIQHYYRWWAHLGCQQSTELTPPADLNGLVRFAERRNLVSARVLSYFNWHITATDWYQRPVNRIDKLLYREVQYRKDNCIDRFDIWLLLAQDTLCSHNLHILAERSKMTMFKHIRSQKNSKEANAEIRMRGVIGSAKSCGGYFDPIIHGWPKTVHGTVPHWAY